MSSPDRQLVSPGAIGAEAVAFAAATISAQLAAEPDDREVGTLLVAQVIALLRADGACLALLDSDPAWLVVRQAAGAAPAVGTRQPSTGGALGAAVQRGEAQ